MGHRRVVLPETISERAASIVTEVRTALQTNQFKAFDYTRPWQSFRKPEVNDVIQINGQSCLFRHVINYGSAVEKVTEYNESDYKLLLMTLPALAPPVAN